MTNNSLDDDIDDLSGTIFSQLGDRIKDPSLIAKDFLRTITSIESFALDINNTFGETRNRVYEIKTGFADAIPQIIRLGGNAYDVQRTMEEIGVASNRNLIATEKQVTSLYAAFRVTGQSVRKLVDDFSDVGVGVDQMSKQIEDSVKYIQSIGGNTKEVFKVVTDNMDQLNRYQFEGGVAGLTKMAAQASMLRYDMRTTTSLADGLYKPERAIEVASAFQRLGLAVGDLGDPFKLMNDSIMDPQGLQDSLIKVSEKFTYFDDKTKTFKISPEGVLHLKELEAQTGVSAREMTKLGLASAEVNRRISQIKSFNLNIDEKDTQLLANLSRINDKGKLEVYVKDENGERSYKELKDISKQQLEATLKEQKDQKEGPEMTLEEIARSQLGITEKTEASVAGIYQGLLHGFGSTTSISGAVEALSRVSTLVSGVFSNRDRFGSSEPSRRVTGNVFKEFQELFKDMKSGKSAQNSIGDLLIKLGKESENATDEVKTTLKKSLIDVYGRLSEETGFERMLKGGLGTVLKELGITSKDNDNQSRNDGSRNTPVTSTDKGSGNQKKPIEAKNNKKDNRKNDQPAEDKRKENTTKFENFSKSIETAFIGNLENIKKTNKGADQGEINKVENNLKEDIKSLVKAFENKKDVNFNELFEKIKNENVNSPEYVKESLKKSYEEFYKTLKSNNNTEVEKKFLEQYEEFIKKNNGGIVSNTNNTTNKYIKGSDNQQQGNDTKSMSFNAYDALLFGSKNISGKPEENKDVANNYSKGVTPVALGGKDKKDNTIYQKIDQNIKIDYVFNPIEVKISGENGKLDATKVQAMINTSLNDTLSKLTKDIAKNSKDKIFAPDIAGDSNYGKPYNTALGS